MSGPHFRVAEFLVSNTAKAIGDPNTPTPEHLQNLMTVTLPGFELARTILGNRPIIISSGYRNPRVNRAVGGVDNSDHALGLAGDGWVRGMSTLEACRLLAAADELRFDQLIYEKSRGVFHLGFGRRMRREVRTQAGGPGSPTRLGLHP